MIHKRKRSTRGCLKRQYHQEEALCRCIIETGWISNKLCAYTRSAVDRRSVTVERIQIDGMIYIRRKTSHNICGGVVWQNRLSRGIENVEHIVHRLNYISVSNAESLIGWFNRKLVSTTRIALLEQI